VSGPRRRARLSDGPSHRIQDTLRKKFADIANDFQRRLQSVAAELSSIEGPLEEQQKQIGQLQARIPVLSETLKTVETAEAECDAAKVEENDYTVFSCQDLEFELELVVQSVAKKMAFIDNQVRGHAVGVCGSDSENAWQIVSRNMTNLTPAQLEQFESTFRYFDKDETNTLTISELAAALASLGIVYAVRGYLLTTAGCIAEECQGRGPGHYIRAAPTRLRRRHLRGVYQPLGALFRAVVSSVSPLT
jgi:hypothetical protein